MIYLFNTFYKDIQEINLEYFSNLNLVILLLMLLGLYFSNDHNNDYCACSTLFLEKRNCIVNHNSDHLQVYAHVRATWGEAINP